MELLIGSDPELFVRYNDGFISGHVFECGTKEEPMKTKHGSVQVDGMALELNIPPAANVLAFIENIARVTGDLTELVSAKMPGASLVAVPTVVFGSEYIQKLPLHVQALGCNPDYNAYTLAPNPAPNAETPFRTGAGHVHLGWTKDADCNSMDHAIVCSEVVKELDYFLGLWSLKHDTDSRRRILYGKAGAFRPKGYGCEYRTLSNFWLNDPKLMGHVFNATTKAFKNVENDTCIHKEFGDLARNCIDENVTDWDKKHKKLAKEIL